MAPPKSTILPAAQPNFGDHFDAWNSSSTGHQRAENRLGGSIGWRQSRNMKLSHQFKSAGTGGERISDLVGAGSKDWDEKARAIIPETVRMRAKVSVQDMLLERGSMRDILERDQVQTGDCSEDMESNECTQPGGSRGIFDGLVVYINGSTYPLISDHKLKHMLASNGARMSLHLGRRTVTHVILGRPSTVSGLVGAGGGLSGTKIQKEIAKVNGSSVKYVGVEWVLESIKHGKRLSETRFGNLKTAAKGQKSVYGMFQKSETL